MAGREGRGDGQSEAGLVPDDPHLTIGTAEDLQAAAVTEVDVAADHHELRQHTSYRSIRLHHTDREREGVTEASLFSPRSSVCVCLTVLLACALMSSAVRLRGSVQ